MIKKILLSLFLALSLMHLVPLAVDAQSTKSIICENIPGDDCQEADQSFLEKMISRVVKPLLFIVGAAAVIMLIVGGLKFVLSAGGQDAVQSAKSTITYALIGLSVSVLAYALVNYVLNKLD